MHHDHMFLRIFGLLYLALMTNVMLALTCLPLLVLLLTGAALELWPVTLLGMVLAVPGLVGAFNVFTRHSDEGGHDVVKPFMSAWRRHFWRSVAAGAVTIVVAAVLAVDVMWVSRYDASNGTQFGAIAIPVFTVAALTVVLVGLGTLVGILERPEVSLGRLAKASVYLMVRRWYLSLVSLVCGGVYLAIMIERPAMGIGLMAAPLLYLVWANTRHSLTPIRTQTLVPA